MWRLQTPEDFTLYTAGRRGNKRKMEEWDRKKDKSNLKALYRITLRWNACQSRSVVFFLLHWNLISEFSFPLKRNDISVLNYKVYSGVQ